MNTEEFKLAQLLESASRLQKLKNISISNNKKNSNDINVSHLPTKETIPELADLLKARKGIFF